MCGKLTRLQSDICDLFQGSHTFSPSLTELLDHKTRVSIFHATTCMLAAIASNHSAQFHFSPSALLKKKGFSISIFTPRIEFLRAMHPNHTHSEA